MEPMVTISLKDYNELKDLKSKFDYLLRKIKIKENKGITCDLKDPIQRPYPFLDRAAIINKNDLKNFCKSILPMDIDELLIEED